MNKRETSFHVENKKEILCPPTPLKKKKKEKYKTHHERIVEITVPFWQIISLLKSFP